MNGHEIDSSACQQLQDDVELPKCQHKNKIEIGGGASIDRGGLPIEADEYFCQDCGKVWYEQRSPLSLNRSKSNLEINGNTPLIVNDTGNRISKQDVQLTIRS